MHHIIVHFQDQLLNYHLHNKSPNIKMFFWGFQIFLWVIHLFEIHIHQFFNCIFLISICFILHTMVLFKYLFPNYINHAYFNCLIIVIQFIFIWRKLLHWQFSQKYVQSSCPKKKNCTKLQSLLQWANEKLLTNKKNIYKQKV